MAEEPYVYPGTQVLRNHFAIHDPDELARRENDASTARQLELQARPLPGRYDLPHLQAFHRHIFGDLYPWGGGDPHRRDRQRRSVRPAAAHRGLPRRGSRATSGRELPARPAT